MPLVTRQEGCERAASGQNGRNEHAAFKIARCLVHPQCGVLVRERLSGTIEPAVGDVRNLQREPSFFGELREAVVLGVMKPVCPLVERDTEAVRVGPGTSPYAASSLENENSPTFGCESMGRTEACDSGADDDRVEISRNW